jgi:Tol biopolymer transport system component
LGLFAIVLVAIAVGRPVRPLAQSQGALELRAAMETETIKGDLSGAIKQYTAVVAKFKSDRAVTAVALVRMAECYQKMGDAQARKIYEQVVKDYPDQTDAVAEARNHMGGSDAKAGRQTNTLVWSGDDEGTISPDGRYLSFVDWDTGDLALHEFNTGAKRYITHTGNAKGGDWSHFAEESAISRDGKRIAFSWWDEGTMNYELDVANLTGEPNAHRLYSDSGSKWLAPRDWSPDGTSIVVMSSEKDGTDRLGLVSVADGSFRLLRSGAWPGDTRVFFSPDGKFVGYDLPEGNTNAPRHLLVYSLAAGREIPVAVRQGQDLMMGWSPAGALLFLSDRTGALGLWGVTLGDSGPGVPTLLKNDLGAAEPLGVTQSGAFYYGLHTGQSQSSIRIADFDLATGRISSPRELPKAFPESQVRPFWSADGKSLAYLSQQSASHHGVSSTAVIRSAETLQVTRELPYRLESLQGWTPDGKGLYGVGLQMGRTGIFRLDLETGALAPLALDEPGQPRITEPVLSQDGRRAYFSRRFDNAKGHEFAFFERDLASGRERELIRRATLGAANLSPDGRYIVTPSVDTATHTSELLLIPVAGGEPRIVMTASSAVPPNAVGTQNATLQGVFWSSDSTMFLTHKRTAQASEIWVVPVTGGSPRKLDMPGDGTAAIRLHPDGRRIAYMFAEPVNAPRGTEIWVLENFLPAAK